MILDSLQKRQRQIEETTNKVLTSMRHTVPYIDIKTASKVLNYSDRGAVKCLNRMCDMKLLREHEVRTKKNQSMKVFVATKNAREYMPETWRKKVWTMKSWRLANHNHDMHLHLLFWDLKTYFQSKGIKEIEAIKIPAKKKERRADFAIIIRDKIHQIELELTLKSKSRYEKILRLCACQYKENPFVWVFKDMEMLHKVYKFAYEQDIHYRMEWVHWNPESHEIRWANNPDTYLNTEEISDLGGIPDTSDLYSEQELDMEISAAVQREVEKFRKFMKDLSKMSILQQRKILNETRKTGFNFTRLDKK